MRKQWALFKVHPSPLSGHGVGKEPATPLATEIASVTHLLKEWARPELGVVETLIKGLHNIEHDIEPDKICQ
jgi:hypothetical protein